jgi:hypothetical protein
MVGSVVLRRATHPGRQSDPLGPLDRTGPHPESIRSSESVTTSVKGEAETTTEVVREAAKATRTSAKAPPRPPGRAPLPQSARPQPRPPVPPRPRLRLLRPPGSPPPRSATDASSSCRSAAEQQTAWPASFTRRRPRCRCGTTRHNTRGQEQSRPPDVPRAGAIERVLRGHTAPVNSAARVNVGSDELHACAGVSSAPGKSSHRRYRGGPAVYPPSAMYRWHLLS